MEPLLIDATDDTPRIEFNQDSGIFSITGKSLPEDVLGFYNPVFSWLENYISSPNENTKIEAKIIYFNSASQRALNEIFTLLSRVRIKNKDAEVDWYFMEEDDEMKEAGEEFEEITNLTFHYKTFSI